MGYDIDQYLEDIQGYPEEEGAGYPEDAWGQRGPTCPKCGGASEDVTGEYFQCTEDECGIKFDEEDYTVATDE